jgi:hypothetical protein
MINGFQQYWLTGSRVYFQRDPIDIAGNGTLVPQPILDFGRVDPVAPAIAVNEVTLVDSDGGYNRVVARAVNSIEESYEVKCSNLSMDMLALLFAANPPTAFTQSATPVTATHWATPGKNVKLINGSGSLVEGTDWEVVSLERGIIKMTGWAGPAANISITYTPRAISGSRLLNPQTGQGCQSTIGTGLIVWGRCGNREQTVREARMQISPGGADFGNENFSTGTIRLSVLTDVTAVVPAGRLLYWLGELPTAG